MIQSFLEGEQKTPSDPYEDNEIEIEEISPPISRRKSGSIRKSTGKSFLKKIKCKSVKCFTHPKIARDQMIHQMENGSVTWMKDIVSWTAMMASTWSKVSI